MMYSYRNREELNNYMSHISETIIDVIIEKVRISGPKHDDPNLKTLHRHQKGNIQSVLSHESFKLYIVVKLFWHTDYLTIKGVCLFIVVIKYIYIGTRINGTIIKISSSSPGVNIIPH